jgi:phosphoglycerate dehydrogenase-like enzyme
MSHHPVRVLIASPLEDVHIETIRRALPAGGELLHEPDLLPPMRYIADHTGPADFRRTPEQDARWRDLLARASVSFDFPTRQGHPHEVAPGLQWIQTTSAGVGQHVVNLGIRPGDLLVTTASGVHAKPLAEFAILALLMAVKRQGHMATEQAARHWERFCGDELTGKTLAIIGPGRIGQEVARLARAFGMRVVALGREHRPDRAAQLGVDRLYARSEMPEMLAGADAIVLCAPHTPETDTIMDRAAFDALRPGVVFVNIGRGQLVDEDALLAKLQDGTIRLAALDVFRTEPLPADSPFWSLPNVLVSPHSASTSIRENDRIVEIFLHNLACFAEGRTGDMRNLLDIERMY